MQDISKELGSDQPNNDAIQKALDKANPALDQLPKNVDDVLKDEGQKMKDAADQAKKDLDNRIKELDDLEKKAAAIATKTPATNAEPNLVEEIQSTKDDFKDVAAKALKDINPDKNVNIFGDDKSDDLRKALEDKAYGPDMVTTPDNAKV